MLRITRERLRQGYRTMRFPKGQAPAPPERFRGLPVIDRSRCDEGCDSCMQACATGALFRGSDNGLSLDLGKCLFCAECATACPPQAIRFSADHRLAVRARSDLVVGEAALRLAESLGAGMRRQLGRSLRLRQVSAGGCNACEADANVLSTIGWDMGRFGIQFVASPRHADGLLVTGPVTVNMRSALLKTYEAVPDPKIVVASGACAISGGPYSGAPEASNGVDGLLSVDLFVPGCPPHPLTLLDGLLRLIGRLAKSGGDRARGSRRGA
jgi:Ni,Fe-hydrogenase III small subunit/formate hydrogenlyase subunit 6/NADH:ubiquinone oxidoreductase subunit I